MHFEDYNYDNFNKHILIDPNKEGDDNYEDTELNKDPSDSLLSDENSARQMVGFSAPPGGLNKHDENG